MLNNDCFTTNMTPPFHCTHPDPKIQRDILVLLDILKDSSIFVNQFVEFAEFCEIIPKTPKLLHFCAAALGSGATWGSLSEPELTLATLAAVTNPGVGGNATGGAARPTTFADSKHLPGLPVIVNTNMQTRKNKCKYQKLQRNTGQSASPAQNLPILCGCLLTNIEAI